MSRPRAALLASWAAMLLATFAALGWLWSRNPAAPLQWLSAALRIGPWRWAAIGALTLAFYALDYVRFATLLGILGYRLRPSIGPRLTAASSFASSLTPFEELHLPTMVLLLEREKIPLRPAARATIAKSVITLVWILAVACLSLGLHASSRHPEPIARWLRWYLCFAGAAAIGLTAFALGAETIHALAGRKLGLRSPEEQRELWRRAIATVDAVAGPVSAITSARSRLLLPCHAATMAFVLAYIAIGWLIAGGLGHPIGYLQAAAIFGNGLLVAYLSPIPGSVGIAEASTAYLLDPALSSDAIAAAVLCRTLCWYGAIPFGALVLAGEARRIGLSALAARLYPPLSGSGPARSALDSPEVSK